MVGAVTLAFGFALITSPRRSGMVLGLGDGPALSGAVGMADLLVGVGILRGRPRWPWTASRAALNVVLADR